MQCATQPLNAALAVDVMNLVMRRDVVRDLHSLRSSCQVAMIRSFSVPNYPHLQLPVGAVEESLAGSCSRYNVTFRVVLRAFDLHRTMAAAEAAVARAAVAAAVVAAQQAAGLAATAASAEAAGAAAVVKALAASAAAKAVAVKAKADAAAADSTIVAAATMAAAAAAEAASFC